MTNNLHVIVAAVLAAGLSGPALAQTTGPGPNQGGGQQEPQGLGGGLDRAVGSIGSGNLLGSIDGSTTPDVTVDIVAEIAAIQEFCRKFPWDVRIDCLSDRLRVLANEIPNDQNFRPMKRALLEASRDLKQVSQRFRVSEAPRRYVAPSPVNSAPIRTEPLQRIRPDSRAEASAQADRVIGQLQTKLLRSAENSRRRALAYQEVAAALNSAKVLLRSAELIGRTIIRT